MVDEKARAAWFRTRRHYISLRSLAFEMSIAIKILELTIITLFSIKKSNTLN